MHILHLSSSNLHCVVVYIYTYIYVFILPYTIALHIGNLAPFLYTPTSLLPEHSVLTDVQQVTGRNGQQWITCRSGGEGARPEIWMGSELVVNNSTANSATIGLGSQHPNGLYHCLSAQSQREYFSLFLRSSGEHSPKPNSLALWDDTLSEFVQTHIILQLYLLDCIILLSLYSHSANTKCPER